LVKSTKEEREERGRKETMLLTHHRKKKSKLSLQFLCILNSLSFSLSADENDMRATNISEEQHGRFL